MRRFQKLAFHKNTQIPSCLITSICLSISKFSILNQVYLLYLHFSFFLSLFLSAHRMVFLIQMIVPVTKQHSWQMYSKISLLVSKARFSVHIVTGYYYKRKFIFKIILYFLIQVPLFQNLDSCFLLGS